MLVKELLQEKTDFSVSSTTTTNKLTIDSQIYSRVKVSSNEHIIMLVGNADGLKRHLDAAKSMGLKNLDNLWIIDSDSSVVESLKRFFPSISKNYIGTPNFICSDFLKFLKSWNSKNKIGFVDFDGTSPPSKYYIDVYEQCIKLNANYVSLIGQTRGIPDKYLLALWTNLGYEEVERKTYIRKAEQLRRGLEFKDTRNEKKITHLSSSDILKAYLERDSGQKLLFSTAYKGAGQKNVKDDGKDNGAQMFAMLFKVQ